MILKGMNLHCLALLAATIFLMLSTPADSGATTFSPLPAGHDTCGQCHDRFPTPRGKQLGKIPSGQIDLLCLGCHGPAGISVLKADIHGTSSYAVDKTIGCMSCHDPHTNTPNWLGGTNIKLVGKKIKRRGNGYAGIETTENGWQYVVFASRGTNAGQPSLHSFADGDEDGNGRFDGICEACHTQTSFHKNDGSGAAHYPGSTCTDCHAHVNQFLADTPDAGGETITGTVADSSGSAWSYVTLFLDLNGNGVYDAGEPTATTDGNGNFTFTGLTDTGYAVLLMDGYIPDGYDVTVTNENNVVTIITRARPAAVEGFVWSDTNASGTFDESDQGIPGITVFADLNANKIHDPGEPATSTDSLGFYTIQDLEHGFHWIVINESSLYQGYEPLVDDNSVYLLLKPGRTQDGVNFGYKTLVPVNPTSSRQNYLTRLTWTPDTGYYVTDNKADSVFIYDSSGTVTSRLNGLDRPLGICTDSQGRIYVGNTGRHNIEVFSKDGILLQTLADGEIELPNDLALDREQRLYVVDSRAREVRVFNADGSDAGVIGGGGEGDGLFSFPVALAIHYRQVDGVEQAELYVADKVSGYIQIFDLDGNFIRAIGGPVQKEGFWNPTWIWQGLFAGIQSLTFDHNGMLHVLDAYMDKVQILDPVTGTYQDNYNAFLENRGAQIQLDIDINATGRVIMTNTSARRVELIHTVQ